MNKTYTLCRLQIQRNGQTSLRPCCMVKEQYSGPYIGREYLLSPEESLKILNKSPDGFEWGYGGSGPAQLALAILLDYCRDNNVPDDWAVSYFQDFKREWIEAAKDDDEITTADIERFLVDYPINPHDELNEKL